MMSMDHGQTTRIDRFDYGSYDSTEDCGVMLRLSCVVEVELGCPEK